jgi:uncharacterized cupin superfamily protein
MADAVEARSGTSYPEPFRAPVDGRSRRALGDAFGLSKYGVNLVELRPGAWSAQRHWHSREDEFVYVVAGELTLVTDAGEQVMTPGMIAGFPAGRPDGHHLVNNADAVAVYLEIGDRDPEDEVFYPDIDLKYVRASGGDRLFTHRNGDPYPQRDQLTSSIAARSSAAPKMNAEK